MIRLSDATLADLPATVQRPSYDRAALRPGILHIGVGNFHRAHQAWYLHRLMQQGQALDWAIIGAGVRPADAQMRAKLAGQDWLSTLIELDPAQMRAEVVGAMRGFVPVSSDNAPLIAQMAAPEIRIVALTVTEGGYYRDPATQALDAAHPDMRHDAAHPDRPRSAFGAMIAALKRRRANGAGPFTAMSCDNLQGNGAVLRQTLVSLARRSDPDLAAWIAAECSFPNSMVDCIVPATGPQTLAAVRGLGIDDAVPVAHENYRQWVIEDAFCAGRPDWDRVGATFATDVHAYEAMKIRILNAGHQVLANAGELLGLPTIADCIRHPTLARFFRKVQAEEIAPTVPAVPGMTPAAYVDLIERRFANAKIGDTTRRVAFDGASRHAGFVLPVLRERLAAGQSVEGLALVEALWARMCAGLREDGGAIAPNDPEWPALSAAATVARDRPAAWLDQPIYAGLGANTGFAAAFSGWLSLLWTAGCDAALSRYCQNRTPE
ncbi:MAG: mannitol dehydrogenase family protein [Pseudomonadota bacterium]